MTSWATADAIFGDLCHEFERSAQPLPESVVAIRRGVVTLWLTAPLDGDDSSRAELLGLAVPIARADTLLYCADSTVVDGTDEYDAVVGIAIEFTSDAVVTRLQMRRYQSLAGDPVRVREVAPGDWEFPRATLLGPHIDGLSASHDLRDDPAARLAAVQTLVGRGFNLALSDELDGELTRLVEQD